MKIVIPKQYQVGGQDMKVMLVDHLEGKLGECCIGSGFVKIADEFKEMKQSESSKCNTFVHELVHSILDTMGRDDLSSDESFVSSFSGFLTEAISSMEFEVSDNPFI